MQTKGLSWLLFRCNKSEAIYKSISESFNLDSQFQRVHDHHSWENDGKEPGIAGAITYILKHNHEADRTKNSVGF